MTTISQLKELSNEELRVRVAECLGWQLKRIAGDELPACWDVIKPDGEPLANLYAVKSDAISKLPAFESSLDAIAEAEKTLSEPGDRIAYQNALYELTEKDPSVSGWHWTTATARVRAIAFLAVRGSG